MHVRRVYACIVRADLFFDSPIGSLVSIRGSDPRFGDWEHMAYVPEPLPQSCPTLSVKTFNAALRARAALASLDSSARQLPRPSLLRRPALRREAQSTSALEGTYAPLEQVLAADEAEDQADAQLREVLNYVRAAEHAFGWLADGRPLTTGLLTDLQARLVAGTAADTEQAGRVRDVQVVIGARGGRIEDARFVPPPPGPDLEERVRALVAWTTHDHGDEIDPVVAAGMTHYQFETLHPFNDGNGRIGRLLVVLHLLVSGVLTEPTLTVSPWFEARRAEYFDRLLGVSTRGDWDGWIRFFCDGLAASADATRHQLSALLQVQTALKERVRAAGLKAETAIQLVDRFFEQPVMTVRQAQHFLGVSYPRANTLVAQLVDAGVVRQYGEQSYDRRFTAPDVLAVLLRG